MQPEDQKIKQIFQSSKYLIVSCFPTPLSGIIVKRLIGDVGANSKEPMSELKVS
jgi:hypothetical protein